MYILLGKSLFKIGTGFNGTLKGHVYGVNADFCKEKNGWIGFCGVNIINFFFIFYIFLHDLIFIAEFIVI